MSADEIALWEGFAVALAGVAAVLAGLVFVAVSINIDRILRVRGLPGRAGESVILFLSTLCQCVLVLIPHQPARALGAELRDCDPDRGRDGHAANPGSLPVRGPRAPTRSAMPAAISRPTTRRSGTAATGGSSRARLTGRRTRPPRRSPCSPWCARVSPAHRRRSGRRSRRMGQCRPPRTARPSTSTATCRESG
jgi:hypothetical protein